MKKVVISICLLLIGFAGLSQQGEQHKIVEIIDLKTVRINIGSEINIKIGDVFQVFGKGQVIHPATGKIVVRENVYLGKIEVVEVVELSSIAKVLENERQFAIGNKIVKVVSVEQEIIEEKKPIQGEFQNPNQRDYSETIYTVNRNEKKTYPKILSIEEKNGKTIAGINKGTYSAAKGGKSKVGKRYYIFVPERDSTDAINFKKIGKEKVIGKVRIFNAEQLKSHGLLQLNTDKKVLQENINANKLMTFIPKKEWYIMVKLGIIEIEKWNRYGSLHVEVGYQIIPNLGLGCGIRLYNQFFYDYEWQTKQLLWKYERDNNATYYNNFNVPQSVYNKLESKDFASFFTLPIFLNFTYDILNKKHSPVIAFRYGFANLSDKESLYELLPYIKTSVEAKGRGYGAVSVYYRFYITGNKALIFGGEFEGTGYKIIQGDSELGKLTATRINIFFGIKL
ncbi:hypothetical protein ACFLRZ_02285 [Bacteroidota bacterium]